MRCPHLLGVGVLLLSVFVWSRAQCAEPTAPPAAAGNRFALLVGVTKYENLNSEIWLKGPINDVELVHRLLRSSKFDFPESNITILKEGSDPAKLPTSVNILAGLDRLAKQVKAGDQVFVLMGGHGSRAPRLAKPNDTNPEATTGLFLPRDVGTWNSDLGKVDRAIADYMLSEKANAILKTGASLMLIMDSCHSGGLVRDQSRGGVEVSRDVPAEVLHIPLDLLQKADSKEKWQSRGKEESDVAPQQLTSAIAQPKLAALYACRRIETTSEQNFPVDHPTEGPYGLFTYTLVHVLEQARGPMTYAELVHAVNVQYDAWGRNSRPIALVEGKASETFVLGTGGGRSSDIRLAPLADGGWKINAGLLRGLNPGSILAVHPPPGSKDDTQVLGHLRVDKAEVLSAIVSPVEYNHLSAPGVAALKPNQVCELVYVDLGMQPLKVCVRITAPANAPNAKELAEQKTRLLDDLKNATKETKLVSVTEKPESADWFVTLPGKDKAPFVLEDPYGNLSFAAPAGDKSPAWLVESLKRIARVRNLKAIASSPAGNAINVELELAVRSAGHPDDPPRGYGTNSMPVLYDSDQVTFKMINHSEGRSVDVALFFISSDFAIEQIYPRDGIAAGENRVSAGQSRQCFQTVDVTTTGQEQVLLIALQPKPGDEIIDFSFLSSNGIGQAREGHVTHSPLADLLVSSQFGEGNRGVTRNWTTAFVMKSLSWTTAKAQATQTAAEK